MKIFIVTSGSYDDYRIRAVFTSQERAERYVNRADMDALKASHPSASLADFNGSLVQPDDPICGIEEFEVDGYAPIKYAHILTSDRYPGHSLPSDFPLDFIGPAEAFKR